MAECPSRSFEQHFADQEMPEQCPVCDDSNADGVTGEPVFTEDSAFCSAACRDVYVSEQEHHDSMLALDFENTEKLIAAHNAQCPQCVNSKRYCFHQEG